MADPREFVLIGNFVDNISPALVKINKSLEQVKNTLESVTKVTKPLNKEFKELSDTAKNFSTSIKGQAADIREITAAMKAMRSEMGRVNRAYRAAGRNRNILPPPPPPPRPPRGSTPPPPPPPPRVPRTSYPQAAAPRGRQGGYQSYAAATGGFVAGNQLSEMITGSIVKGFQLGVNIMVKPFQYAGNAFGERVRDELSDIQSAGGLFATDIRYNLGLFKSFNEARRVQEDINARLAKSAAELPGETAQYVREAKRITDTMIGAMGRSQEAFVKYAESIGAKQGDRLDALSTVIQKFTEKSVLLGMQPGGGGTRSMYGIPQLLEMLVNMPKANVKAMSYRYAALRDNPLLANALQQGEDKINATAVGTAERLKAIMEILDQALPNEVVSAMRNSMDGVIQTFKSAFIDPEVGLFGLGRKLNDLVVPRVDALGRYLDKSGNVVENVNEAFKEQTSLYGLFRDILAGFAVPLSDLVGILPQIYDPLRAIGLDMVQFRNIAQNFLRTFNGFTKGFEELAQLKGIQEIKRTAGARGALLTVANLLQNVGKIDTAKFQEYSQKLQQKDVDFAGIAKQLFSDLFDSKFMKMLGEVVGNVIGGTIKMVGDLMAGVTDMASAGPFAEGLKKGWDSAKGSQGISKIFSSLFKVIGNLLVTAFKSAPFEMSVLAALTVGMPLISGVITSGITALFEMLFRDPKSLLRGVQAFLGKRRVVPTQVQDLGTRITNPARMLPPAQETALATTNTGKLAKGMSGFSKFFMQFGNYVKGVGPRFMGFFKGFLGKLSIFGGIVTSIISLFQGEDLATSLAKGAGPVLGAALGAALVPVLGPIGPMIGSLIGGWIGSLDTVTQPLADALRAVFGTLQTTFDFLVQIGKDLLGLINGLVSLLPGVSKNFNFLRAAMFALLSPFKMLEIAINGLYDLYLWIKSKTVGVSAEERARMNERRTQRATDELTIMGREGFGHSLPQQKAAEYAKFQEAKAKGDTAAMNRIAEYMKSIDSMIAQRGGNAGTPAKPVSTKPTTVVPTSASKPATTPSPAGDQVQANLRAKALQDLQWLWKQLTTTPAPPAQTAKPAQEVIATARNTTEINSKAAAQVTQGASVQKSSDEVKKNTTTANVTLGNIRSGIMSISNKLTGIQNAMLSDLNNIQAGVNSVSSLLSSGQLKVQASFPGMMPGGPMGGAPGGLGAAQQMASQYGLQLTSWFRPGDKGMHGAGRAMDFSNGVSTPQQMAFAQAMVAQYGSSLKELIYTPLGFGIKDGTPVPLSYWGARTNAMHYNHVHVAFAEGAEKGRMFTNQRAAGGWEESMVPGSVKVSSITGNSAEGFGGNTVGDIHVTVNAGATNDPDQLAYMVAVKIQEAVGDAVNSNILV